MCGGSGIATPSPHGLAGEVGGVLETTRFHMPSGVCDLFQQRLQAGEKKFFVLCGERSGQEVRGALTGRVRQSEKVGDAEFREVSNLPLLRRPPCPCLLVGSPGRGSSVGQRQDSGGRPW